MPHRVIPYADRIGAKYYKPSPFSNPRNWMQNNKRWIRKQMQDGKEIVDVGPDMKRRQIRGPSKYYEMERQEIASRDYTAYIWEPQP